MRGTHASNLNRCSTSSATSVGSVDRDFSTTTAGKCAVACCTFGQSAAGDDEELSSMIPLERAPHDLSEEERVREVTGPPPP